jgi:hypothetical protein
MPKPPSDAKARVPLRAQGNRRGGFIFGFLLMCIALMSGALMTPTSNYGVAWVVVFITYMICSVSLAIQLSKNSVHPISFMLIIYFAFGLFMPALYQLSAGFLPWPTLVFDPGTAANAAVYLMFCMMATLIGNGFAVGRRPAAKNADRVRQVNPPRLLVATALLTTLSAILVIRAYMRLGPNVLFATRGHVVGLLMMHRHSTQEIGIYLYSARAVTLASLAASLYTIRLLPRGKFRLLGFVLLAVAITNALVIYFPTSIARFEMLAIIGTVVFILFPKTLFSRGRWFTAAVIPFVYVLFPLAQAFTRTDKLKMSQLPSLSDSMRTGDYDGLQSIMNIIYYVGQNGVAYGGRLLSSVLFFVPRSIWVGKFGQTGGDAARSAGNEYTNISMPLPGELYADGGVVLGLIGMCAIGFWIGRLDKAFAEGSVKSGVSLTFLLVAVAAGYTPILVRGPLLGVINQPATACIAVVCWSLLAVDRSGKWKPSLQYLRRIGQPRYRPIRPLEGD